jgi:hypothetical protein
MFDLAIKGGLPLIAVRTTDPFNVGTVLRHISGRHPLWVADVAYLHTVKNVTVPSLMYAKHAKADVDWDRVYETLVSRESTLVLVNFTDVPPMSLDAGEMPVPREMVLAALKEAALGDDVVAAVAGSLGGLTLKEVSEVVRITEARDGSLTAAGAMRTRQMLRTSIAGLEQVDTDSAIYWPPSGLQSWLQEEDEFFILHDDPRLRPRGLMFTGAPGNGKTQGAKHVARHMGVPLYRVDVGAAMTKWQGESERAFSAVLHRLDHEEPCVVLFDEVDKLFVQGNDDTGTVRRMLSSFLWWLQEHTSRVLTVMTCNDLTVVPPELYRAGRIDRVLTFDGLPYANAVTFVSSVCLKLGWQVGAAEAALAVNNTVPGGVMSYADAYECARRLVKRKVRGSG